MEAAADETLNSLVRVDVGFFPRIVAPFGPSSDTDKERSARRLCSEHRNVKRSSINVNPRS
jgi:hypothetical protein